MMPTIRIDDEVWRALKERAEPFVDTPNDVLRRLLLPPTKAETIRKPADSSGDGLRGSIEHGDNQAHDMEPGRRGPKGRVERTPEEAFRMPILQALVELGGQGAVAEVVKLARQHLKAQLKPDDFKRLKTGEIRWENTAKWERKHLIDNGLLDSNSSHGVWRITPLGRDYLKEGKSV